MTITLLKRRALSSFRVHHTSRPPHDGVLVVEHEFDGGPFNGRRMTGFASTFDMQVVYSARGKRTARRSCDAAGARWHLSIHARLRLHAHMRAGARLSVVPV